MFDTIAPRYDLVNRLMTFGLDQALAPRHRGRARRCPPAPCVLDLACGTGDLSRARRRAAATGSSAPTSAPGMLAANGAADPARRGRRQPPPLRRRRLRRARLRLRAAQLHRPGRHAGRGGPGAAPGRAPRRARGRRAHARGSGAPATTSGSPRSSPSSAAPSRTGGLPLPARARWPTCRPTPVLRRMLRDAGFSAVGIRPLAGGLSQLVVATRAGTAPSPPAS